MKGQLKGSVEERGGSFRVVVSLGKDAKTGRYRYLKETVKTKRLAEKRLAEIQQQLEHGAIIQPGKTTLQAYLERWLADYAVPNLAPTTTQGYRHMITKHLVSSLGGLPLAKLKAEHIQRYMAEKQSAGLSARTVRHHYVTLHTALETAVKWGLLSYNSANAVTPPRYSRQEMRTLNEAEINTLLEAARDTPFYPAFFVALYTGLRRSELLALRWSDIDLLLCQLSVSRTMHHPTKSKIVFRQPKTAKSRRSIALSPQTVLVLREHREKLEALWHSLEKPLRDDDLVFCQPNGRPLQPDTVTHAWLKLSRRCGLKGVRLHDLRHTHASLMLKQGVHPKIVQERLGHSSIQVTLDTYSHVAPGLQEQAAQRFDDNLKPYRKNGNNLGINDTSTPTV